MQSTILKFLKKRHLLCFFNPNKFLKLKYLINLHLKQPRLTYRVWKLNSALRNHTLRVEIALGRIEITFCVQKLHSCMCSSQYACGHHKKSDFYTQSVVVTRMSVPITFVSVIITLIRVNITLCVFKSQSWVS
jgi:hypothetical protein